MSKSKQKAVALKYRTEQDAAPVVIASGYGNVAEKIIDIAEQKGIPVFRDDSAASLLCMLEVGTSIPPELYQVVASIYCQLLKVSETIKGQKNTGDKLPTLQERSKRLKERKNVTSSVIEQENYRNSDKAKD